MSEQLEPIEKQAESPPPAAQPARVDAEDPRVALNRLAATLAQNRNPRFLVEYLRLRRLLRA
jgi:hypothetical protein